MRTPCARVLAYGSDGLGGLEGRYGRLVASLADADWPTQVAAMSLLCHAPHGLCILRPACMPST